MSEYPNSFFNYPAGPIPNLKRNYHQIKDSDVHQPKTQRQNETNETIDTLLKVIFPHGAKSTTSKSLKRNRNEIYALVNALLVKKNHLNGDKYSQDIDLTRDIQSNFDNGDFILILRADGRIVAMTEEAEQHLGKNMRSLYAQCINIYDCLDQNDAEKFKQVLDSSKPHWQDQQKLIFTFRLPKGKRPSRLQEDIIPMSMSGHFYSCHNGASSFEKLFVGRCQALLSSNSIKTGSIQNERIANSSSSALEITLNEDLSVLSISPNTEAVLGYRRIELVNSYFSRFLPMEDWHNLEKNCRESYQKERNGKKLPKLVCGVCDIFTSNGDGRLTFFYRIRAKRTRRTRPIKYEVSLQLIDPELRNEYLKRAEMEKFENEEPLKAEQVNLVSPSSSASENYILADSPSLSGGLLADFPEEPEIARPMSGFSRFLSKEVGPLQFDEYPWYDTIELDKSKMEIYFTESIDEDWNVRFFGRPDSRSYPEYSFDSSVDQFLFEDGFCF